MTTREVVNEVLENLPDTATLDDVMYALYVRAKIEKSEQRIAEGDHAPHSDVVKRMERWLR